jgi:hypothetical protein
MWAFYHHNHIIITTLHQSFIMRSVFIPIIIVAILLQLIQSQDDKKNFAVTQSTLLRLNNVAPVEQQSIFQAAVSYIAETIATPVVEPVLQGRRLRAAGSDTIVSQHTAAKHADFKAAANAANRTGTNLYVRNSFNRPYSLCVLDKSSSLRSGAAAATAATTTKKTQIISGPQTPKKNANAATKGSLRG